jgi:hypothetical protein
MYSTGTVPGTVLYSMYIRLYGTGPGYCTVPG